MRNLYTLQGHFGAIESLRRLPNGNCSSVVHLTKPSKPVTWISKQRRTLVVPVLNRLARYEPSRALATKYRRPDSMFCPSTISSSSRKMTETKIRALWECGIRTMVNWSKQQPLWKPSGITMLWLATTTASSRTSSSRTTPNSSTREKAHRPYPYQLSVCFQKVTCWVQVTIASYQRQSNINNEQLQVAW